jgi:hypothetical protein
MLMQLHYSFIVYVKQTFKLITEADVTLHGTVFLSGVGVYRKKLESANSTPSSTELKNIYSYDSSSVCVFTKDV